jgi:hypothetical protein
MRTDLLPLCDKGLLRHEFVGCARGIRLINRILPLRARMVWTVLQQIFGLRDSDERWSS